MDGTFDWLLALDIASTVLMFVPGVGTAVGAAVKAAVVATRLIVTAVRAASTVSKAASALKAASVVNRGIYIVPRTIVKAGVPKSGKPYVGMSFNIDKRLAQHVAQGKITPKMAANTQRIAVNGNRNRLRVAEQNMINSRGLENLSNLRNEIAPSNWVRMGVTIR